MPTGFPATPPGLSFSFVKSFTTVVPKLYSDVARSSSSISKSPCVPGGGGLSDSRGLSGACCRPRGVGAAGAGVDMVYKLRAMLERGPPFSNTTLVVSV